ncbi:BN159_2729 family protein [Streptomyces sp. NPDC021056]|uniref:BN159_2729 family protein n=1 Tax=Streptomyces sp. NPDC021056 TaxID=3155012 RepID=UPI0033E7F478
MNSNLLHAAGVVRTVLVSVRAEQAAAVAYALDSARLLVDPERSFGVVLHRTPDGHWAGARQPATELERQALAWDDSCARAREVARAVERELAGHPGPYDVRVDGDRVRVLLRVDNPAHWVRWRVHFGITAVGERPEPRTVTGEGERDGVRVTVVAHGMGTAPPSPRTGRERCLFHLDGTTYDLTLPQRDAQGDVWYFQGSRTRDGMPLMSLDGRPERCTLANVAAYLGPLTPVPPVMPGAAPTAEPPRASAAPTVDLARARARRSAHAGSRARNPAGERTGRPARAVRPTAGAAGTVRMVEPRPTGPATLPHTAAHARGETGGDGSAVRVRPLRQSPAAVSGPDGPAR